MTRAKKKAPAAWSYQAGERGTNRVNLYDRGARGLYLEYRARASSGGPSRRVRESLGHIDREEAKAKADETALRFRTADRVKRQPLTLRRLIDIYEIEVTPGKAPGTQEHDRRSFEMFLRFFGADRFPETLSLRDVNGFVGARRSGKLRPASVKKARKVGDRIIQSDLALLSAVLNYATLSRDGGGVLLERNPLKGLPIPKNESPARPVLSAAQYLAVRSAAAKVGTWAELFVVLSHETGHRAGSIRQLRFSDIDFTTGRAHWRGEADKIGNDHWTPLTDEALDCLLRERNARGTIGDAVIFPARRGDRSQPMTGDAAFNLWKQLAKSAGIPEGQRFGWHSLRRKFGSDLRKTNLRDLCDLGGWKSIQTVLTCYVRPDEVAQRDALVGRSADKRAANS
jgi:integrase